MILKLWMQSRNKGIKGGLMKKLNLILIALGVICFTCLSASGLCAIP
ncbi:hypothetical protein NEOC95_000008 [Neochlamydia sp. AcF95]|nr:hypothetical protein [Neochlamydia sp. AcF95]